MVKLIIIVGLIIFFWSPILTFIEWIIGLFGDMSFGVGELKRKSKAQYKKQQERKQTEKQSAERKRFLAEIDSAYASKNYKSVIELFRQVINDNAYTVKEKIKYCHIAADSVCNVANTVGEFEEARTWVERIQHLSSFLSEETNNLFSEITKRGGELLAMQDKLIDEGMKAFIDNDYETGRVKLEEAIKNGSFNALMLLADMSTQLLETEEDLRNVRELIERIKAVDAPTAKTFEESLKQTPYVRFITHTDKAKEYAKIAENKSDDDKISILEKEVNELEQAYEAVSQPATASVICKKYAVLSEVYKNTHQNEKGMLAKYVGYCDKALEWTQVSVDSGNRSDAELLDSLKDIKKTNKELMERANAYDEHIRKADKLEKEADKLKETMDRKLGDKLIELKIEEARELEAAYAISEDPHIAKRLCFAYRTAAMKVYQFHHIYEEVPATYDDYCKKTFRWGEIALNQGVLSQYVFDITMGLLT